MVVGPSAAPRRLAPAGFVLGLLFFAGSALLPSPAAAAAGEWRVPEAPLRFQLTVLHKPSHPSAGFYVHLPDGGVLRNMIASTTVMTDDGKELPSYLMWQNVETGFSFVFADPGIAMGSTVYVYLRPDKLPVYWSANTGVTPSPILSIQAGRDNLGAAQALGKFGRVDAQVHGELKAGIQKAPLSIGGDDSGRPKPGAFYLLTYVEAALAGKFWFAPFIRDGVGEVYVDGNKLNAKERSKKWGGEGAYFELTKGLHRVEIFQTAPGTGPYATDMTKGGLMYLTWLPPKETLKDVEARVLKTTEIARSGDLTLVGVEAKDGSTVACARAQPDLTYWFEGEDPLIIYNLKALAGTNPPDTTYTWSFPEGGTREGADTKWLFPAFREYRVKLTAKSSKGTAITTLPFFGFGTTPSNLNRPPDREALRSVMASMLEAYPTNPDPVANWGDGHWNNLMRTVEQGEGYALLRRLFTDRWETIRKKLGPAQLYGLEDMLLDIAQRDNPKEALGWLQRFAGIGADPTRLNELKLREAELQMYYLNDRAVAGTILAGVALLTNDVGERAKIRLGDLAFLSGDLNKATSLYVEVQNRARKQRNAQGALPGGLVSNQLVAGGPARPGSSPDWRNNPLPLGGQPPKTAAEAATGEKRSGALQEVSLSENVRTLIDGDFLLEARKALQEWERAFPLSKISSDYILRESAYYSKQGDWKRARPMLEAYCREIDASSFLPDAATMLINAVKGAKEDPASIRPIIEKVLGRLKYHPVAGELEAFLKTGANPAAPGKGLPAAVPPRKR